MCNKNSKLRIESDWTKSDRAFLETHLKIRVWYSNVPQPLTKDQNLMCDPPKILPYSWPENWNFGQIFKIHSWLTIGVWNTIILTMWFHDTKLDHVVPSETHPEIFPKFQFSGACHRQISGKLIQYFFEILISGALAWLIPGKFVHIWISVP